MDFVDSRKELWCCLTREIRVSQTIRISMVCLLNALEAMFAVSTDRTITLRSIDRVSLLLNSSHSDNVD